MNTFRIHVAWAMTVEAENETDALLSAYKTFRKDYPSLIVFKAASTIENLDMGGAGEDTGEKTQ